MSSILVGGAVALALMETLRLNVRPEGTVCISRMLFGLRCPGCGLTDSFVAIAGGHFAAAYTANPLGPILFALLALVIVTRMFKARSPGWRGWREVDITLAAAGVIGLVARTVIFYASSR